MCTPYARQDTAHVISFPSVHRPSLCAPSARPLRSSGSDKRRAPGNIANAEVEIRRGDAGLRAQRRGRDRKAQQEQSKSGEISWGGGHGFERGQWSVVSGSWNDALSMAAEEITPKRAES